MSGNIVLKLVQSLFRGDRRRGARYDVALPDATLASPHGADVTIRDLSLTGALLEGTALPQPGAAVSLIHRKLVVAATVAWSEEGRAGIHFDRPLPVEQLFTIVHSAQFRRGNGVPASLAA